MRTTPQRPLIPLPANPRKRKAGDRLDLESYDLKRRRAQQIERAKRQGALARRMQKVAEQKRQAEINQQLYDDTIIGVNFSDNSEEERLNSTPTFFNQMLSNADYGVQDQFDDLGGVNEAPVYLNRPAHERSQPSSPFNNEAEVDAAITALLTEKDDHIFRILYYAAPENEQIFLDNTGAIHPDDTPIAPQEITHILHNVVNTNMNRCIITVNTQYHYEGMLHVINPVPRQDMTFPDRFEEEEVFLTSAVKFKVITIHNSMFGVLNFSVNSKDHDLIRDTITHISNTIMNLIHTGALGGLSARNVYQQFKAFNVIITSSHGGEVKSLDIHTGAYGGLKYYAIKLGPYDITRLMIPDADIDEAETVEDRRVGAMQNFANMLEEDLQRFLDDRDGRFVSGDHLDISNFDTLPLRDEGGENRRLTDEASMEVVQRRIEDVTFKFLPRAVHPMPTMETLPVHFKTANPDQSRVFSATLQPQGDQPRFLLDPESYIGRSADRAKRYPALTPLLTQPGAEFTEMEYAIQAGEITMEDGIPEMEILEPSPQRTLLNNLDNIYTGMEIRVPSTISVKPRSRDFRFEFGKLQRGDRFPSPALTNPNVDNSYIDTRFFNIHTVQYTGPSIQEQHEIAERAMYLRQAEEEFYSRQAAHAKAQALRLEEEERALAEEFLNASAFFDFDQLPSEDEDDRPAWMRESGFGDMGHRTKKTPKLHNDILRDAHLFSPIPIKDNHNCFAQCLARGIRLAQRDQPSEVAMLEHLDSLHCESNIKPEDTEDYASQLLTAFHFWTIEKTKYSEKTMEMKLSETESKITERFTEFKVITHRDYLYRLDFIVFDNHCYLVENNKYILNKVKCSFCAHWVNFNSFKKHIDICRYCHTCQHAYTTKKTHQCSGMTAAAACEVRKRKKAEHVNAAHTVCEDWMPLTPPKLTKKPMPNKMVWTADIEAFADIKSNHAFTPYQIGCVRLDDYTTYTQFKGKDCMKEYLEFVHTQMKGNLIYYNGGRFDAYLHLKAMIIHGYFIDPNSIVKNGGSIMTFQANRNLKV